MSKIPSPNSDYLKGLTLEGVIQEPVLLAEAQALQDRMKQGRLRTAFEAAQLLNQKVVMVDWTHVAGLLLPNNKICVADSYGEIERELIIFHELGHLTMSTMYSLYASNVIYQATEEIWCDGFALLMLGDRATPATREMCEKEVKRQKARAFNDWYPGRDSNPRP